MTDRELPETGSDLSHPQQVQSLRAALKVVRNREAQLGDIAEETGEAERARLQVLAAKVGPLLDEVDARDDRFELVLSPGTRPRLWIDMTAFVVMGPDREGNEKSGYRLLRDTRFGRVAIAESMDLDNATSAIATYMAHRIVEREKMLEGDYLALIARSAERQPYADGPKASAESTAAHEEQASGPFRTRQAGQTKPDAPKTDQKSPEMSPPSRWFLWICFGFIAGAIVSALWFMNAVGKIL